MHRIARRTDGAGDRIKRCPATEVARCGTAQVGEVAVGAEQLRAIDRISRSRRQHSGRKVGHSRAIRNASIRRVRSRQCERVLGTAYRTVVEHCTISDILEFGIQRFQLCKVDRIGISSTCRKVGNLSGVTAPPDADSTKRTVPG